MIDVRVAQDDGVDCRRIERERSAVFFLLLVTALYQAAFEQDVFAADSYQVARARDSSSCAKKLNVHVEWFCPVAWGHYLFRLRCSEF